MPIMDVVKNFRHLGKKIVAVGRNYKDHAAELGNAVPTVPMLFLKPSSAYISPGEHIKAPEGCIKLQQEVEFAVVIGKKATKVQKSDAMDFVGGYALALDMTARDFQETAKKQGHPWLLPKGFDTSCPVSEYISKDKIKDPHNVEIWCKINNQLKQKGNTSMMIFDIPTLLEYTTKFVTLEPGDLLLTGTPAGVSTLKSGDEIVCGIEGVLEMKFTVE